MVLEVFSIAWSLGIDNLDALMYKKSGERFPRYARFVLKYIAPFLGGLLFLYALYSEFKKDWDAEPLGHW